MPKTGIDFVLNPKFCVREMSLSTTNNQPTTNHDGNVASPRHILIAVMGVTGAGKSSFIKTLTGQNVTIGHSVESCTADVTSYSFQHENLIIHLIDTPGFNDTNKSDTDVLNEISVYLATAYRNGVRLTGIIYLHRISDNRMQGSTMLNLEMFKKLCGEDCLPNVILATTMWSDNPSIRAEQERREAEITMKPEYWGSLLSKGARSVRYEGDYQSAIDIVSRLEHHPHIVLDIQRQIVDDRKTLDQTPAGMLLREDIIQKEGEYKRKLQQACKQMEEALSERDEEFAKELRQKINAIEAKVDQVAKDKINLKADLNARLDEKQRIIDKMASDTNKAVWKAGLIGAIGGLGAFGIAAILSPATIASLSVADIAAAMEFGAQVLAFILNNRDR